MFQYQKTSTDIVIWNIFTEYLVGVVVKNLNEQMECCKMLMVFPLVVIWIICSHKTSLEHEFEIKHMLLIQGPSSTAEACYVLWQILEHLHLFSLPII